MQTPRARLPYLEKTPENQHLIPRDITLFKCLAHSPGMSEAVQIMGKYIRHESRLNGRLRQIGILAVAWSTKSQYEWSHGICVGKDFGVTDQDVKNIISEFKNEENNLDHESRIVIKAAQELTNDIDIKDDTFTQLQNIFDNECLTDFIMTISFYNAVSRYIAAMRIGVESKYQSYLKDYPMKQ